MSDAKALAMEFVEAFRLGDGARLGGALKKFLELVRSADWAAINEFLRELLDYLPATASSAGAVVTSGIADAMQTVMLIIELFTRLRQVFA